MMAGRVQRAAVLLLALCLGLCCLAPAAHALRPRSDRDYTSMPPSREDLMTELATIRQRWPFLSHAQRQQADSAYLPAPLGDNRKPLPGLAKVEQSTTVTGATIIKTPHCRIIFGSSYSSYINKGGTSYSLGYWTDADGDGMPKYIELLVGGNAKVAEGLDAFQASSAGIMEQVWVKEIAEMGFTAPPGTDTAYLDVYIANTGVKNPAVDFNGTKGITLPGTTYGVTATYQNGAPYVILNQDMISGLLQVTSAHEFFHAVQIAYVDYNTMLTDEQVRWLAESTATWMEDAVYPLVNDYVNYVWQMTASPQWSLLDPDLDYAAVLFQKYLSEQYHAPGDLDGSEVIKALWAGMQQEPAVVATMKAFLAAQTANPRHTLAEAYGDFVLRNLDLPANYVDGKLYDPVTITSFVAIDPQFSPSFSGTVSGYWLAPSHYGSTYLKVDIKEGSLSGLANRLKLDFSGSLQPRWQLRLVPLTATGALGQAVSLDVASEPGAQLAKEDNALYTTAYVVVSALPYPEESVNVYTAYNYDYTVNAYVATRLAQGWNLQHVSSAGLQGFGAGLSHIVSAWRWTGGAEATWAVALPNAAQETLDAYLQEKGFVAMTAIGDDDGVWLHSDAAGVEEGGADPSEQQSVLADAGWTLLSSRVPSRVAVSPLLADQGAMTLWKWDAVAGQWAFYTNAMDAQALAAYIADKGFSLLTDISYGDGFWVNGEAATILTLQ